MRSCITQVRSPFIKRVLLNTATCEPLPKIPGLLSHNPKAGAWDCILTSWQEIGMHILV